MLAVWNDEEFNVKDYFDRFKELCKGTKYFQGDGFGVYYFDGGWKNFKSEKPIWECDFDVKTKLCLIHARFASKKSTIGIENNMPFMKNGWVFMFNGNLRKVSIESPGGIGADKLFNYWLSKDLEPLEALKETLKDFEENAEFIRGMNIVLCDGKKLYVLCRYEEDEDYFTIRHGSNVVCSGDLDTSFKMNNGEIKVFDVSS